VVAEEEVEEVLEEDILGSLRDADEGLLISTDRNRVRLLFSETVRRPLVWCWKAAELSGCQLNYRRAPGP
jgi:hypothetical protein